MPVIRKVYWRLQLCGRLPSEWDKYWEEVDTDEFGGVEYIIDELPLPKSSEQIEIILRFLPDRGDPTLNNKIGYLVDMLKSSQAWKDFSSSHDVISYGESNQWIQYLAFE